MTWRERIVAARERGEFTPEEQAQSSSWMTCAVGEAHHQHPLVIQYTNCQLAHHDWASVDILGCGSPMDRGLAVLGDHLDGFCYAVMHHQFDRAEACLDKIEDRILELKRAH